MNLTPATAYVLRDGTETEVPVEEVDVLTLGIGLEHSSWSKTQAPSDVHVAKVADSLSQRRVERVGLCEHSAVVEPVARAVANSPLVKTALHGADPNFGRILQAAGAAYAVTGNGLPFQVDLDIQGERVVSGGTAAVEFGGHEWRGLEEAVRAPEVEYVLTLPGDGGETEVFFSDLGHEYVTINAEYTT